MLIMGLRAIVLGIGGLASLGQQIVVQDDTLQFSLRLPLGCESSVDVQRRMKTPHGWSCAVGGVQNAPIFLGALALRSEVPVTGFDTALATVRKEYPSATILTLKWQGTDLHSVSLEAASDSNHTRIVMAIVPLTGRAIQLTAFGVDRSEADLAGLLQLALNGFDGVRAGQFRPLTDEEMENAVLRTVALVALVSAIVLWRRRSRRKASALGQS